MIKPKKQNRTVPQPFGAGNSNFKLIIWWHDGNCNTFWSRDYRSGNSTKRDNNIGLRRLYQFANRNIFKIKNYLIYDKKNGDTLIVEYINGQYKKLDII
jgi:hypothetical protein